MKQYEKWKWEAELDTVAGLRSKYPNRTILTAGKADEVGGADSIVLYERCSCLELREGWHRNVKNRPGYKPIRSRAPEVSQASVGYLVADLENVAAVEGENPISAVLDEHWDLVRAVKGDVATKPDPEPTCEHDPLKWSA